LNVIPIRIHSLRERKGDIPLLIQHFVQKYNKENQKHIEGFNKAALEILTNYSWPGNVRELENMVERIVVLKSKGEIAEVDLPDTLASKNSHSAKKGPDISSKLSKVSFKDAVEEYESQLIQQALEATGGNKNKAAELLGLNRTTLVEKIKRRQIGEGA